MGGTERERGATLVEAAFVLPMILLLTFGMWTVARAWQVQNTIDHAVREGARYGSTIDPWEGDASQEAIRAVVEAELAAGSIPVGQLSTVCIDITTGGRTPEVCGSPMIPPAPRKTENIVVRIRWADYPMDFIFFRVNVDLTGTAISRWED